MSGDMPLAVLPNVGLASMSAAGSSFHTRRLSTSANSPRRHVRSVHGSSAAVAERLPRRLRRSARDRRERGALDPAARSRTRAGVPARTDDEATKLERLLADGTFVVSVQLDPPLGANPEALMATARAVRDSGKAQFVDVNDNPRARARMSGIMASVAIERFTGVETIPHLTPRDTTIAGLESQLLGAHAEGVRNILVGDGRPARGRRLSRARTASTRSTRSGSSS